MGNETLNINVNYLTDEFDKQKISLNAKLGDIARKIQLATKPTPGSIPGVATGPDCNAGVSEIMNSINDLSKTLSDLTSEINEMVEAYEWAENYVMGASETLGSDIKYTENSMGGGNWNTIRADNIYAKPGDEFTVKYIAIYADGQYKYNMILGSEELSLDERIADLKKKGFISENAVITVSQGLTKKQADGSLGDIGWLEQVKYIDPEKNKKKRSGKNVDKYEKIENLYTDTSSKEAVQQVIKEDEAEKLVEKTKSASVFKVDKDDDVSYTLYGILGSCQTNNKVPGDLVIEDIHGKRYYFQADTSKPNGEAYDINEVSKVISDLDGEVKIETNYTSKDGSKGTTTYTGAIVPISSTDVNRDGSTNIGDVVAAQKQILEKQSQINENNSKIENLNSKIESWEREDTRRRNSLQTSTHGYDINQAKAQVSNLKKDNKNLQGEIDELKETSSNVMNSKVNSGTQNVNNNDVSESNQEVQTTTETANSTTTNTTGTTASTTTTTTTTATTVTTGVAQTTGPSTTTGTQTGGTSSNTTTTTTTTTAAPGTEQSGTNAQTTTGPSTTTGTQTGGTSSNTTTTTTTTTAAPGTEQSGTNAQTTTGPSTTGTQTGGTSSNTTTTRTTTTTAAPGTEQSGTNAQTTTGPSTTTGTQTGGISGNTATTTTTTTTVTADKGIPSELRTLHHIYPDKSVDELWKMKKDLYDWEMPGD